MHGMRSNTQRGGGYYDSPPPHPFGSGVHYGYSAVPPTGTSGSAGASGLSHRSGRPIGPDRLRQSQFTKGGSSSSLQYDEDNRQTRMYLDPPRPRSDSSQAKLWSAGYMRPFTPPTSSGRNVECCILVRDDDTGTLRPCGATLKHILGTY
jgi:hypothetical protein